MNVRVLRRLGICLSVLGLLLFKAVPVWADANCAAAKSTDGIVVAPEGPAKKTLNILGFGNSFTYSLDPYFQEVVKSAGYGMRFGLLTIGGKSLEQHWSNIQKEEADPTYKQFKTYTYREKLQSVPWDVVVFQQSSPLGWKPESFFPFVQDLADYVKKNAPTAEVLLQQTWSYRADDKRLEEWGLTQESMFRKLVDAYAETAKKLGGVRVIPMGEAVQWARGNQPQGYKPLVRAEFTFPNVPDMGNYFTGNIHWNDKHTALEGDAYHLNARGRYLQACVWFAFLFDADTEEVTYVPAELTPEDARFIRQAAQRIVNEKKAK